MKQVDIAALLEEMAEVEDCTETNEHQGDCSSLTLPQEPMVVRSIGADEVGADTIFPNIMNVNGCNK